MRSHGRTSSLSGGESITMRLRLGAERAPVAAEAGVGGRAREVEGASPVALRAQARRWFVARRGVGVRGLSMVAKGKPAGRNAQWRGEACAPSRVAQPYRAGRWADRTSPPTSCSTSLIGFAAQLVDGALGMAYGVTASSLLLGIGVRRR